MSHEGHHDGIDPLGAPTDGEVRRLSPGGAPALLQRNEAEAQADLRDALPAGIALLDRRGVIVSVNDSWRAFTGIGGSQTSGYGIGLDYLALCDGSQGEDARETRQVAAGIRSVLAGEAMSYSLEYPRHSLTGRRWFLLSVMPLAGQPSHGVFVMLVDITEEKIAALRRHRLDRLHAVLGEMSQAFLQTRERQELYDTVCRIVVEHGRLRTAFIAGVDPESGLARPVAAFGEGREYLLESSTADEGSQGMGRIGAVLRTGLPDFCNDIAASPHLKPWHESSRKYGFKAIASFPLMIDADVVAVLVLCAGETDYFQADEVHLVRSVANNLSFAMEMLRKSQQPARAEGAREITTPNRLQASIRDSDGHYRALVDWFPEAIIIQRDGKLLYCNPAASRMIGAPSPQELHGRAIIDLIHPDDRHILVEWQRRMITDDHPMPTIDRKLIRLNGTVIDVELQATRIIFDGEAAIFSSMRDITERKRAEQKIEKTLLRLHEAQRIGRIGDWEWDIETQVIGWSPQVFEILGRDPYLGPPRDYEENATYYDAASRVLMSEKVSRAVESGEAQSYELVALRPDGEQVAVQAMAVPRKDPSGKVVGLYGTVQDITERRRSETLLRESEERFRSIFHTAATGIAISTPYGRFLQVNAAYCRMLGYSEEELLALDFASVTFPEDLSINLELRDELLAGQRQSFVLEKRYVRKNREIVWTRQSISATRALGGGITTLIAVSEDITERKLAEENLAANAALLQQFVKYTPAAVAMLDTDMRYIQTSERWIQDYRIGNRDIIGLSHYEVFPDLPPLWRDIHQRVLAGAIEKCDEAAFPRIDGTTEWLQWEIRPWHKLDGKIGGLIMFTQVITERKLAQETLHRQQTELRVLFDLIPAMLCFKDTENRFLRVNQRLAQSTGKSVDEIEGKSAFDIYPDHADKYYADDLEVIHSRAPKLGIVEELLNRDGHAIWVQTDKVPFLDAEGNAVGLVVMAQDITERKRYQDEIRELNTSLEYRVSLRTNELTIAREEAEQANRAKSDFLATMSHEIRTPMNGVIGMLDVLHHTSLRGDQVEMVDLIRESAYALLHIIEDILDLSKIEAGKLQIESAPLQIVKVVEKASAILDVMAVKCKVRLIVFVDPKIPRTIMGDEIRLGQVLNNLTSNAIKFSSGRDEPGRVSVRAEVVERDPLSVAIDLIVTDNGIGMDEVTLARVFTPFSQADASTTRRYGGTGLGLSISNMLVGLMGGKMSVRSTPGQGSTFTVNLRFAIAEGDDDPEPMPRLAAGLHCRVIGRELPLADDVDAYLTYAGATVERVPDLAAAAAAEAVPGSCVWLTLPDQPIPASGELRALARTIGTGNAAAETRFIALGYGNRRKPRVEGADLVCVDVAPLFRRTLLEAVALASDRIEMTGSNEREQIDRSHRTTMPLTWDEARRQGRLILVAEDSEMNRKVILHQVHLIGYTAKVVDNGLEALKSWRSGDFALLLTDLHMPQMDGYALVAAIRAEEATRENGRRLPIIALTANALRDEEQRCRAAGMDDYLTKPVQMGRLQATIDQWLNPSGAAQTLPCDENDRVPVADIDVLAALVGNDPVVIGEMLKSFRRNAMQYRGEMNQGIASGSLETVARTAHKLKAAVRSIGAARLGEICARIEVTAEAGNLEELHALMTSFQIEMDAVNRFLDARETNR